MSAAGCHIQLFARTPTSPIQWRLLSGNNREIARGCEEFADEESSRIAIKELQTMAATLERRISRIQTNRWAWELLDGDRALVVGRSVDRLIRCEQALALAAEQIVSASIGAVVMVSTARRWGSVAS